MRLPSQIQSGGLPPKQESAQSQVMTTNQKKILRLDKSLGIPIVCGRIVDGFSMLLPCLAVKSTIDLIALYPTIQATSPYKQSIVQTSRVNSYTLQSHPCILMPPMIYSSSNITVESLDRQSNRNHAGHPPNESDQAGNKCAEQDRPSL